MLVRAVAASLFVEPVEFAKGVSVKFPLAEDAGVRPLGLASLRVGPPIEWLLQPLSYPAT